jgi:hypothetical protein
MFSDNTQALYVASFDYGDFTADRDVDGSDLKLLIDSFGSFSGDPNYNVAADLNKDGAVNTEDLSEFVSHFG